MDNNMNYNKITDLLSEAGIKINGPNPWDMWIYDERVFSKVISQGTLGLGEAYLDNWWDVEQLDEFVNRVLRSDLRKKIGKYNFIFEFLKYRLFNWQSKNKCLKSCNKHYDIGNDLYQYMLDKRMAYSCGYWKDANTLDEAQEAKLELICQKLQLKPGQQILDIGCGWGSFAKYAAEKYGVSVTGITVSKEQQELGRKLCGDLPISILVTDYRDMKGQFDHVVSVGMFEHVGYKNYRKYFEVVNECLKPDGLFLLQTIGGNESVTSLDGWYEKYLFPVGMVPSIAQIGKATELLFVMEDFHNFGPDYDKTLMAWFKNFDEHWEILKPKYDDKFYRIWKYYLLSCAGIFRAREEQLWQIVFSKNRRKNRYERICL